MALKLKLSNLWPNIHNWDITLLGKGFLEFHFNTVEDMRRIWAIGVANLNLGLMRFFCWSSDFSTQAHALTHAQIWVRFLHLPQEYWRKQTLLEITSRLGTPLIIDDATLHRRLGLYARVLVDVDLFEQLFESVIVERGGHSLFVMVRCERQPSFCTHCKMLGHEVRNCMKLSTLNMAEGTSKVLKAPTVTHPVKKLPVHNGKDKNSAVTHVNRHAATVSKMAQSSKPPDTVDLVTSDPEETNKEGGKGDEAETAAILKVGAYSTLSLHNSFEILNEDDELPLGEARQAELESQNIPNGEILKQPEMDDNGPRN